MKTRIFFLTLLLPALLSGPALAQLPAKEPAKAPGEIDG